MVTFKQFINEKLTKNVWQHLLTTDIDEYADDLVRVVSTAYKFTSLGAFVKNVSDVKSSDWQVVDYDHKPDVDVAIFFRQPRKNETWVGNKIQGIGHDGNALSKEKLLDRLEQLLQTDGWWIEASDALAKSLIKRGVKPVIDQKILKTVFPTIISFNDDGSYVRTANGSNITEFVFGRLNIK